MLKKGQIINLEHKAKQFVVLSAADEKVKIQFTNGHPYEVCRNGEIYDCDFRNTGKRVLLRQSNDKRGYKLINVRACNQSVQIKVHRLVALCFIPNPNNLPHVNHKSENPAENSAENLEWCDAKYNVNYSLAKLKANLNKRPLHMNAKLTKDKVRAMMPKDDHILVLCDSACEVESAYQVAIQTKREMGEAGDKLAISKSNKTLSVLVRTGI